jgi:hypothetical protein
MLEKQDVKIGLEREKVEAAKMEAQDGVMKAMNVATQLSLAKVTQESKILMADMVSMDPLARAWHEMYHERVCKEMMAAQAATASMASSAPSTHMCMPAYMPTTTSTSMAAPMSTDEVPQVIADEEDVVEVQLPLTPFL